MKTIGLKLVFLLLMVAGSFASCQNNDENNGVAEGVLFYRQDGTPILKNTKWKLVGVVEEKTGKLIKLEPKDCEECFTLVFDTDYTATVRSINVNTLKLDLLNLNPYINLDDSIWWELYDKDGNYYDSGNTFRRAILVAASYATTSNELKLYYTYDGEKYLLFKLQNL